MTARVLFYLDIAKQQPWVEALKAADPGLDVRAWPDWGSPDDGPAYAFVWEAPDGLIAQYPNIKAVFSIGAGVDHLTRDPSLPADLPIIRMSDDGLKEGMSEYVLMAVLMIQRRMPELLMHQRNNTWQRLIAPAAADFPVGIMGYGALGQTVARALKPLGYPINTWTRTPRQPDGVADACFAGQGQLPDFLRQCRTVVGLLPDTPETKGLINAESLAALPKGAGLINAGRGPLVEIDAVISALASGHLSAAFLDVFTTEPLASDHPAWTTPNMFITPHVAAITRPSSAARYVADGIRLIEQGGMPSTLLDRRRGY